MKVRPPPHRVYKTFVRITVLAGLTSLAARPVLAGFVGTPTCEAHTTTNAYSDNVLRYYCTAETDNSVPVRIRFGPAEDFTDAYVTTYDPASPFHDFDLWGLYAGDTYYYRFESSTSQTSTYNFTVGSLPTEIQDMDWVVGTAATVDTQVDYVAYDHASCDPADDLDYLLILRNDYDDEDGDTNELEVVWYNAEWHQGTDSGAITAFEAKRDAAGKHHFYVITEDHARLSEVTLAGKVLSRINYGYTCSDSDTTDGPCLHHAVFPSSVGSQEMVFAAKAKVKRATETYPFRSVFGHPAQCGTGTGATADCDTATETYFAVDGIEVRAPTSSGSWPMELTWDLDVHPEFDPDECSPGVGDLGARNVGPPAMDCGGYWDDLFFDGTDKVYDYSHVNSVWHDGNQYAYVTSPYYSTIAKYQPFDSVGAPDPTPDPEWVINAYDDASSSYAFDAGTGAASLFPYDIMHHVTGIDGETGTKFLLFDNFGNECFSRGIQIEIADWDTGLAGEEWQITDVWEMDMEVFGEAPCTASPVDGSLLTGAGHNCMTHGSVYEVAEGEDVLLSCGRIDADSRGGAINDAQGAIMEFNRGTGAVVFSISPVCDNGTPHNPYRAIPLDFVRGGAPRY